MTTKGEFLDRIGIELEGGWDEFPAAWKGKDVEIISDLSIDGRTLTTDFPLTNTHVGEVVSPPLSLDEWEEWLKTYYPASTNITTGLHVHISLLSKRFYSFLMSTSFERRVLAAARALGEEEKLLKKGSRAEGTRKHYLWDRLDGKNPFCLFGVLPKEQTPIKEKRIGMRARYASLNYCWSMHGTLEYRLLPMFPEGAEMATKFISSFLKEVEAELMERENKRFYLSTSLRELNGIVEEKEVS